MYKTSQNWLTNLFFIHILADMLKLSSVIVRRTDLFKLTNYCRHFSQVTNTFYGDFTEEEQIMQSMGKFLFTVIFYYSCPIRKGTDCTIGNQNGSTMFHGEKFNRISFRSWSNYFLFAYVFHA